MKTDTAIVIGSSLVCIAALLAFSLFFVLRASGLIDWGWVWVFSPFWLPIAAVVAWLVSATMLAIIVNIIED